MKVILVCLINACKIFATQCDCDSQARLSLPNNLLASNVSQSLRTENWQYYCIQMCTTEMKTSYSSAQQAIISISCSLTLNVVFTARAWSWWRCAAWELSLCRAMLSAAAASISFIMWTLSSLQNFIFPVFWNLVDASDVFDKESLKVLYVLKDFSYE